MPYKNIEIGNKLITQNKNKTQQFYKGFSTIFSNESTQLYDFELVKQDIINHFNTKKGERIMNPEFGSIIWNLLMEPLTESTTQQLKQDIERICTSDPRVTPTKIELLEYPTGYLLELTLLMVGTDQTSNLKLIFDQNIGLSVQ